MTKQVNQKLKTYSTISLITMILGVLLLVFMIVVEDEPGALPLFLIVAGSIWFFINRTRIKKLQR